MLRSGTTTFSDMYFFMNTTAEVVKETGIRAVLSRGLAGVSPTADQALVENADLFAHGMALIMTVSRYYLDRMHHILVQMRIWKRLLPYLMN